ncbi:MAG TPA: hypothetical protein VGG44_10015 [Tepidisphaeraceae bacterium]|jgi:hypothetical protein
MIETTRDFRQKQWESRLAIITAYCRRRLLILSSLLLTACAANGHPQKPVNNGNGASSASLLKSDEIDAHVRGFSDAFMSRVALPYDQLISSGKTPEVRSWALKSRFGQAVAVLSDATGPNPTVNLLDVVVLVTLKRISIEEYWIPHLLHDDGNDLLAAYRQSETEVWNLAARIFTSQQIVDLHRAIAEWRNDNPNSYYVGFIKFTDFLEGSSTSSKHAMSMPSSLLGLLYIDPLAGLDPVTQEARGFRVLAERLMFVAMRMPFIMNCQVEEVTDNILNSPQIQRLISSSEQYAKVGDRFNDIVAKYPADFSKATKGAIDQINSAATEQRKAITKELNSESDQIHGLLADARQSIVVARDSAASINDNTIRTITVTESGASAILNRAVLLAIILILVGFLWPAIVLLGYHYCKKRWIPK